MRLGYCVNMIALRLDGIGWERIGGIKRAGLDYVELPLAQMMLAAPRVRRRILRELEKHDLPCLCCNNFFPGSYRLTGPNANHSAALAYAENALIWARQLGAKTIVFGSSGARNMPVNFPTAEAHRQLTTFLQIVGDLAAYRGITLAIEPLNPSESNLLPTFQSVCELSDAVGHSAVGALADTYHMKLAAEPLSALARADGRLRHVHIARTLQRSLPAWGDEENYPELFRQLRQAGYDGTVSIEAYLLTNQTCDDIARSVSFLKTAMG